MYSRCIITFLIVHGMLTLFFLVSIRLYIVLYYLIFLCPTEWWYFLILAALFVCNIYLRVSVYRTKNSGILFWYYMVILDGWCWGAICSLIPLGSLICAFDIVQILFSYTWPAWWKWNIQVMYMYILIKLFVSSNMCNCLLACRRAVTSECLFHTEHMFGFLKLL